MYRMLELFEHFFYFVCIFEECRVPSTNILSTYLINSNKNYNKFTFNSLINQTFIIYILDLIAIILMMLIKHVITMLHPEISDWPLVYLMYSNTNNVMKSEAKLWLSPVAIGNIVLLSDCWHILLAVTAISPACRCLQVQNSWESPAS